VTDTLKKAIPLLALSAGAWLLYANWKLEDTQATAFAAICGPADACADDPPIRVDKGPFAHRYTWQGTDALVHVTCRREQWLVGRWTCRSELQKGAAPRVRDDLVRYPHETKRGASQD
jgi:hypothetical protein